MGALRALIKCQFKLKAAPFLHFAGNTLYVVLPFLQSFPSTLHVLDQMNISEIII